MSDILKDIQKELPKVITSATFEAANIVLYTDDEDFYKDNGGKIRELVSTFKKRIELRMEEGKLLDQEETEKVIKECIPDEAGVDSIFKKEVY
jgi:predicted metal-dependent RNase